MEPVQRSAVPVPSPPRSGEIVPTEKDELSAIKAGLRKVKIFTEYVSSRRAKKACREEDSSEGRCSARSEDGEYNYPFDSDSLDDFEDGEVDEGKEDSIVRKSFSYGSLASANCAGGSFYSSMRINSEDEDWVYLAIVNLMLGAQKLRIQLHQWLSHLNCKVQSAAYYLGGRGSSALGLLKPKESHC